MMRNSGIYKIICKPTGKIYIGSSVNIQHRWSVHRATLRGDYHHNNYLQHAWNKYGEDSFGFEVIELCDREQLPIREQYHLDTNKPYVPDGFNISFDTISPMRGQSLTPEHRAKISASEKGRIFTPEHCAKLSEVQIGKKLSVEHRSKLSAAHKGKILSPEHRAKVAAAGIGRKQKPESIAKLVTANEKTWVAITPDGIEIAVTNMKQFCQENNLHPSHMSAVALGKLKHHKGWKCRHVE